MSWRVLYIEKANYLSLYLDNLKIKQGVDESTIPLSDINSIVIDNNSLTLTVPLINKCMEYKINIILCDIYHLPNSIIFPYSGNYQSPFQLNKQIKWSEKSKKYLWQRIVKQKIYNQRFILKKYKSEEKLSIDKLGIYEKDVVMGDTTNREGHAAKVYFHSLFGSDFVRQADDSINASLNYGYSILRSQICRALIGKGLDAKLGIFHKGMSNEFNLADDLIETFRPIIDEYVYKNVYPNNSFNHDVRLEIVELTTKKVLIKGKKQTIVNAINIMIDGIITFFDTGDIDTIVLPVTDVSE